MAKGAYIGIDGVAKKIKGGYIGVDDKARKIKKAYIGIGGVARPCWGGGTPAYYGQIDGLRHQTDMLSAASVGDYALFAGGHSSYWYTMVCPEVTAYNSSLVQSYPTDAYMAVYMGAASIGDYAVFHGGVSYYEGEDYISIENYVAAYNSSLTQTFRSTSISRYGAASGTIGNYALFAGGYYPYGDSESISNKLYTCDGSLTFTELTTTLTNSRAFMRSFKAGNYLLFTGGFNNSSGSKICEAFDTSLTKYGGTLNLSNTANGNNMAGSVGQYGIVITPACYSGSVSAIDIFDSSLTKITGTMSATSNYSFVASMTLKDYAFFIPDKSPRAVAGSSNTNTIVFDSSLTQTQLEPPHNDYLHDNTQPSDGGHEYKYEYLNWGVTVGNFALIGGGIQGTGYRTSMVEAYTVI